jgi:hypothetical protein
MSGWSSKGSVRKSGEKLRVNVECVSTANGYQLWSRRYDHHIHDVFAVQDEIAREIINMMCINTPGRRLISTAGTDNFEAYDRYLRGRYHLNRQTGESLHRAIDCFSQGLAQRPGYAAAASERAVAWLHLGLFSMLAPMEGLRKQAPAACVQRAGGRSPVLCGLPPGYVWLGLARS